MKPISCVFLRAVIALQFLSGILLAGEKDVEIFDGKTLKGWVQRGGKAEYRVEAGEIIGRCVPNTPNSFLCTEGDFSDFILELDFKVDPGLNSGVQVRSHSLEEPRTITWKDKDVRVGPKRVHGMQVEIDPSDRAWTGGLYEEGARGWFANLKENEAAQKAFHQNDWNHFKIQCRGSTYRTWLNGVPAAELEDTLEAKGFIALQVHGVGKSDKPREVRFRNFHLKMLIP